MRSVCSVLSVVLWTEMRLVKVKGFTEGATYSTRHDFLRCTKFHDFIMRTVSIQHEQIEAFPIEYTAN